MDHCDQTLSYGPTMPTAIFKKERFTEERKGNQWVTEEEGQTQ